MGCGYDFACRTCKKSYYLGYGSYGTWMTWETLAEFDADQRKTTVNPPDGPQELYHRDIRKNQNIRQCLKEHAGHDHTYIGWDWCGAGYAKDGQVPGALYSDTGPYGTSEMFIEDYGEYEKIDLAPDPPPPPAKTTFDVPLKPEVAAQLEAWQKRNGISS